MTRQFDRWSLVVFPGAFLLYNMFFFLPLFMQQLRKQPDPRGPPVITESHAKRD